MTELDRIARELVAYFDGLPPTDKGVPVSNWLPTDLAAEQAIREGLERHRLQPLAIVREHRARWRRLLSEACAVPLRVAERRAIAERFGVSLSVTYRQGVADRVRPTAGAWDEACEAMRKNLGPGVYPMTVAAMAAGRTRSWLASRLREEGGEMMPGWMRLTRRGKVQRLVVIAAEP